MCPGFHLWWVEGHGPGPPLPLQGPTYSSWLQPGRSSVKTHWLSGLDLCLCCLKYAVFMCVWSMSHVWLFETPWTVALQAPLSMGFSRQEYWSGSPFPSPRDLPNPGIEPRFSTLQADSLLVGATREAPCRIHKVALYCGVCLILFLYLFWTLGSSEKKQNNRRV